MRSTGSAELGCVALLARAACLWYGRFLALVVGAWFAASAPSARALSIRVDVQATPFEEEQPWR